MTVRSRQQAAPGDHISEPPTQHLARATYRPMGIDYSKMARVNVMITHRNAWAELTHNQINCIVSQ